MRGLLRYKAVCHKLKSLSEVPTQLELKRPVLAAIDVYGKNGWYEDSQQGRISKPNRRDTITGRHAIVLVAKTDSGYRFANTWGVDWGDQGFGFIEDEVAQSSLGKELYAVEAKVFSSNEVEWLSRLQKRPN